MASIPANSAKLRISEFRCSQFVLYKYFMNMNSFFIFYGSKFYYNYLKFTIFEIFQTYLSICNNLNN